MIYENRRNKVVNYSLCALFAALTAVCSWISLPFVLPFTLQTFSVFLAFLLLGGKYGLISTLLYVFLGIAGLPVFSGFNSGFSALIGPTGGYIWGFIASAAVYWLLEHRLGGSPARSFLACALSLAVCYFLGTAWYAMGYAGKGGAVSFFSAFSVCVLPYIIPDLLKIAAALALSKRLKKIIGKN